MRCLYTKNLTLQGLNARKKPEYPYLTKEPHSNTIITIQNKTDRKIYLNHIIIENAV